MISTTSLIASQKMFRNVLISFVFCVVAVVVTHGSSGHELTISESFKFCQKQYPGIPDTYADDEVAMKAAKENAPYAKCFMGCMFKKFMPQVFKENGEVVVNSTSIPHASENPEVNFVKV